MHVLSPLPVSVLAWLLRDGCRALHVRAPPTASHHVIHLMRLPKGPGYRVPIYLDCGSSSVFCVSGVPNEMGLAPNWNEPLELTPVVLANEGPIALLVKDGEVDGAEPDAVDEDGLVPNENR